MGHMIQYCWQHQPKSVSVSTSTALQSVNDLTIKGKTKINLIRRYESVVGMTRYREGEVIAPGNMMGVDHLNIAFKKTDPNAKVIYEDIKIEDIKTDPMQVKILPLPSTYDNVTHCHKMYQTNVVTFDPIEDTIKSDPTDVINLDDNYPGRMVIVSDYVSLWRCNLTLVDPNSRRVKPQYPRDIVSNEEMPPIDIYKILNRAVENFNVINDDNDPLWFILKDSKLLTDIYNFIQFKTSLDKAYSLLPKPDLGAWNRRDLILIEEVKKIYQKHGIKTYGWRLYTNIISEKSAVEVFETCIMVAKLIEKFELKKDADGEYNWIPTNRIKCHDLYEGKDPCRPGVMSDIVGRNLEQIYLN
jgi:hypothetical protein